MTERTTLSPFERRLAAELERYVAGAWDPKPAAEVASEAMHPAGPSVRARRASQSRRLLLFGLAAALLIPAASIGALVLRDRAPAVVDVPATAEDQAIFVRRTMGAEPGVAIFAVRPDGGELLVRQVPDAILTSGGTVGIWGSVSDHGWLALGAERNGGPWPMILVDLADPSSEPWVIHEANLGGIGASWGPTGLVAAEGRSWQDLLVVDPEARATSHVSMQGHGLVGGGPSIIWTADGRGFVGSTGSGAYEVVPLDGSAPSPAVGQVFARGRYGVGLAELRICSPGAGCPGGDDGRVERVETDGSAAIVWRPSGGDRALAATFAATDGYWLTLDHDQGRQVVLLRVRDDGQDTAATINRDAGWMYVGAMQESPDEIGGVVWIDLGGKPAALTVPLDGAPPTFHEGQFAGYLSGSTVTGLPGARYEASTVIMPNVGEAYRLPTLDALIASELTLNPGRTVLGKGSRDGVQGDGEVRTFEVTRDVTGDGEAYLDCLGPSSVTVTSGGHSVTSPCLMAGSYGGEVGALGPITVEASGDTSWRVVVYSP